MIIEITHPHPYPHLQSSVPVHVPDCPKDEAASLSEDELRAFPAFRSWLSTLTRSLSLQHTSPTHPFHRDPYKLESIAVRSITRFGFRSVEQPGKIGFLNISATLTNSAGESLPGAALLRGPSVAMLIVLQPEDVALGSDEDNYVLLTVQARVPAGSLGMVELPAGMLDDQGSFGGAAAKEVEEECGFKVGKGEMVDLTALTLTKEGGGDGSGVEGEKSEKLGKGVYMSPGGCDEFIPIFLHQRRVKRGKLNEMGGKLTGLRDEGEKITLRLCPLNELWRVGARDAKALAALALYEGLKREGKLPAMTDGSRL